jgi:CheY-like chemotaxis protein/HPt (histidine-containing phosphotransfer) domain-containing protein
MSVVTARPLQDVDGVCGCRVLVAEDDATSQDIVLLMLDRLGYHADLASDGLEAVSAFQDAIYDVVLMDVRMPRMDGIEAARQIRADLDPTEQPTIIAMSADTTSQCREECFRAGMDQHLAKPLRIDDLATLLASRLHPQGNLAALSVDVAGDNVVGGASGAQVFDSEVLDALLADLGGDADLRTDLIESFIFDATTRSEAIVTAGESADFDALVFQAHALQSASATLGLLALAELAREIEGSPTAPSDGLSIASQALRLVAECRKAIEELAPT